MEWINGMSRVEKFFLTESEKDKKRNEKELEGLYKKGMFF